MKKLLLIAMVFCLVAPAMADYNSDIESVSKENEKTTAALPSTDYGPQRLVPEMCGERAYGSIPPGFSGWLDYGDYIVAAIQPYSNIYYVWYVGDDYTSPCFCVSMQGEIRYVGCPEEFSWDYRSYCWDGIGYSY